VEEGEGEGEGGGVQELALGVRLLLDHLEELLELVEGEVHDPDAPAAEPEQDQGRLVDAIGDLRLVLEDVDHAL
jgi:hypothetical protein